MKIRWNWCDLFETTWTDLVYYDTVMWAAYFLGERDDRYEAAKRLVKLVNDGEKRAIVSYLLIVETIYTIRKRIVLRSKSPDDCRLRDAKRGSNSFEDYVVKGLRTGMLILVGSDGMSGHDYKIFSKTRSVEGGVKRGKYKALGHADVEHAYWADYGRASEFHTMDSDFECLRGDPDFDVKFIVH